MSSTPSLKTPARPNSPPLTLAALLLMGVAALYAARGMPWVNVDDLAFAGTGIDLAQTGRLTNHLMRPWLAAFGTDRFFVQMPGAPYALAAWIKLAGVGTGSFLVFQWLWYAVGIGALLRVTHAGFGLPRGGGCLLGVIYLTQMVKEGLRPEAQAFALALAGLALMVGEAGPGRRCAACCLVGAAILTYPLALALALPLGLALVYREEQVAATGRTGGPGWRAILRGWIIPVLVATFLTAAALLAMIHLEFAEFGRVFLAHARLRTPGLLRAVPTFMAQVGAGQEAVLVLPVLGVLVATAGLVLLVPSSCQPGARAWVLACAGAAVLCVVLYASVAVAWVVLFGFAAAAGFLAGARLGRKQVFFEWAALSLLFVFSQSLWIVRVGRQRAPAEADLRRAREASGTGGVVVDSSTSRYVFDYHLPAGALMLDYLVPFNRAEGRLRLEDKAAAATWLVTRPILGLYVKGLPAPLTDYPRVHLGTHDFKSMPLTPDEPLVIP